jgi:hypothetical protein
VLLSGNLIPFLTAVENVKLAVKLVGGDRTDAQARARFGSYNGAYIFVRRGHVSRAGDWRYNH